MTWLLAAGLAAALVAAGLAVVLFVPARVRVDAAWPAPPDRTAPVRVRVRWLFVHVDSAARAAEPAPAAPDEAEATARARGKDGQKDRQRDRKKTRGRHAWRRVRAALASRGFVPRVLRLATDVVRVLRPRRVFARARLGFEDPMHTGVVFGALNGLLAALPSGGSAGAGWDVRVEAEFVEPALEGEVDVEGALALASVLWPAVRFASSPAAWRALVAAWRAG